jgi:hypothetical protein
LARVRAGWALTELVVIDRERAAQLMGSQLEPGPAAACLERLYDAHIGATPLLATDLVRFRDGDGVWGPAAARLSSVQTDPRAGLSHDERIWRQAPLYALLSHLAMPVLRAACIAQGRSIVVGDRSFSHDATRIAQGDYSRYEQGLEDAVKKLLATEEALGRAFWLGAAHHIVNALFRGMGMEALSGEHRAAICTGDLDGAFLSFLITAEPDFRGIERRQIPKRAKGARATLDRSGIKPKEGGVEGVLASRSIEDIPDMLNSEFLTPGILLTEKLISGPFLIRHRPPARRPKRHVLLVGACADPADSDGMRFAKAAWLQAAFRLAGWLSSEGLGNGEIRWIERAPGDGLQILRANTSGLVVAEPDLQRPSTADAVGFYKGLRWFPGMGDRRPGRGLSVSAAKAVSGKASGALLGDRQIHWLKVALGASWQALAGGDSAVDSAEFSHVHVQLLRADPTRGSTPAALNWPVRRHEIVRALQLPHTVPGSADLLSVAHDVGAMRLWRHKSLDPEIFDAVAPDDTDTLCRGYAQIIDSLCHGCLTAMLERRHGG